VSGLPARAWEAASPHTACTMALHQMIAPSQLWFLCTQSFGHSHRGTAERGGRALAVDGQRNEGWTRPATPAPTGSHQPAPSRTQKPPRIFRKFTPDPYHYSRYRRITIFGVRQQGEKERSKSAESELCVSKKPRPQPTALAISKWTLAGAHGLPTLEVDAIGVACPRTKGTERALDASPLLISICGLDQV